MRAAIRAGKLDQVALLDDAAIAAGLAGLEGWELVEDADGRRAMAREWQLTDFAAALGFVVRVGALAQRADHHPDVLLHGWNRVRLTLSTHAQGGLTQADLDLAARLDGLS